MPRRAADEVDFDEPVVERFQAVRKCTAGDAAAEMETLNHSFFAFKNIAQGGEVNVVYKRSRRRVRRDRAGGHGLTSDAKETPPSRRAYVFVGARDGGEF